MLKVSGLLNERMFGKQEPIKRGPDGQWLEDNQGHGATRRSLYLAQTRTRSVAFLHVFDCPDMTSDNQPERFRASLPTQSLALMNNPLVMRTSKAFTQEVLEKSQEQLRRSGEAGVRRSLQPAAHRERTGDREEVDRRGDRIRRKACACSSRRCSAPTTSCTVTRRKLEPEGEQSHEEISYAQTGVAGSGRRVRRDGGELHAAAGPAVCRRVGIAKERIYDLKPKPPHFAPKAKRVIFIYIGGGPSTIDMFDPKPALMKYDGKPAPFEIKGRALNGSQQIMASPWKFTDCGESGRQVSDLLPYFQKVVDKVTFVRSMTTDRIDHSTAQFTFVTGRGFTGFPSIGSWVSYALGSENQNLPAYIALGQGATIGDRAHSSAWLPPVYNGTSMRADPKTPIFDIKRPDNMSLDQQRRLLDTIERTGSRAEDSRTRSIRIWSRASRTTSWPRACRWRR